MRRFLFAAIALGLNAPGVAVAEAPPVVRVAPDHVVLTGRVVDHAEIIPMADELRLTKSLARLERTTTDQMIIVTIESLHDRPIEDVARDFGNKWGVGRKGIDNGIVLLVAPNERQVRIEVGYGLAALLTNKRSTEIVNHMLPLFRQDRAVQAIELGTREISRVLQSNKRRPQYLKKAA